MLTISTTAKKTSARGCICVPSVILVPWFIVEATIATGSLLDSWDNVEPDGFSDAAASSRADEMNGLAAVVLNLERMG